MSKYKNQTLNRKIYRRCCNFNLLENTCKDWAFEKLRIKVKNEFKGQVNAIGSDSIYRDLIKLVSIENGSFSRIESLDANNREMQFIKIYAKDEFREEKYVEVMIQIEERTPAKTK